MTISELSYLYDILQGVNGIFVLLFASGLLFMSFRWLKYFADPDEFDEQELKKYKKDNIKYSIYFLLFIFIMILVPSPRTIVIHEIEKKFDKSEVNFLINKIVKENE